MTATDHYLVIDPIGTGGEPEPPLPAWDDPAETTVDAANEPGPANVSPGWPPAVSLDTLVAALLRCIISTREVGAGEWTAWRVNLAGEPGKTVANRQAGRKSISIKNNGPSPAYICRQEATPAGPNTWTLAVGEGISMAATAPISACTDVAGTAQLQIAAEYDLTAPEL